MNLKFEGTPVQRMWGTLKYFPYLISALLLAAGPVSWAGGASEGGLPAPLKAILEGLSNFASVFLGIFFQAVPFLLLGTLASALVEEFLPPDELSRLMPCGTLGAAITGGLMGLFFPVCECGVVPRVRSWHVWSLDRWWI